jgi:UDP-N-acetyl-2-amino-2-deoxyglucuronate dehydrogenase
LDVTVERIESLIAACRESGMQLGVILPARFGAGARAAKHAVEQGRFGQLTYCCAQVAWFRSAEYYVNSSWRGTHALDGGGALTNQSIHAIDLLLWLAGDVVEVSAHCQTRLHAIEAEDNAVAWVRFANGAIGTIMGSTACLPR